MVSVMAGLMLDRRLVMRYAARGRGKAVYPGGGLVLKYSTRFGA